MEHEISGKIGGGPQMATDDAAGEIGDDEMVRSHVFAWDTAWFNGG